jgi:ABC-2 type transport system ATP-binding protein
LEKQREPIVEIRNLTKTFADVKALDDLSFEVARGSLCGFLGPNGSGKSTTLRILTSLVRPDSGEVKIFGKHLNEARTEILNKTGILIERPNFYENLSAWKNLSLLMRYSGLPFDKNRIHEVLQLVGLDGRAKSKVGGFSEGMKQRLGLAQALLNKPKLLVVDEPFNSLDPQGVRDLRELILQLNRDEGITVLVSSHNLDEIARLSTDMVLIKNGRSIAKGPVRELLAARQSSVNIEVKDALKALTLIKERMPDLDAGHVANGTIRLNLEKTEIPALIKVLSAHDIDVYGVSDRNTLEQFFLSFTKS